MLIQKIIKILLFLGLGLLIYVILLALGLYATGITNHNVHNKIVQYSFIPSSLDNVRKEWLDNTSIHKSVSSINALEESLTLRNCRSIDNYESELNSLSFVCGKEGQARKLSFLNLEFPKPGESHYDEVALYLQSVFKNYNFTVKVLAEYNNTPYVYLFRGNKNITYELVKHEHINYINHIDDINMQ